MTSTPSRLPLTSRHYESGVIVAEKYELQRLLGEGGMGSVWLAQNRLLEVPVALKLLRADFDAADAADRLLREARVAAKIGHRAIVRVFDFGHTAPGDPFIVMELLEGKNLQEVLAERGPLGATEAVQLLLPVVDALAAAHDAGVVHRDLKPANIFLVSEQRRTQPKIVDFGIAKMSPGAAGAAPSITRHGEVVGSPGYMSPEQARGLSRIGGPADIWAVCVVLYECITGRQPFVGENYNAWLRSIIEDAAKPTTDFGAGDQALWRIVDKSLQKEPEERWASMRELGAELARWLLDRGVEEDVCGDPVQQYLESPAKPAVLGVSGKRRLISVHAGVASEAHTLQAADSSRLRSHDDEASYRESASPLTHTKRPEVTARMTRGVIALTTVTVLAAAAGVIAAFSVGTARNQDGVEQHVTRSAVVGAAPPSTPSRRAAVVGSDPSAPLPPAITVDPAADEPAPAVQPPSSAPSPSKRDAHRRVVEKVPALHPSASTPAVHSPAAPAGELKDPY